MRDPLLSREYGPAHGRPTVNQCDSKHPEEQTKAGDKTKARASILSPTSLLQMTDRDEPVTETYCTTPVVTMLLEPEAGATPTKVPAAVNAPLVLSMVNTDTLFDVSFAT